MTPTPTGRTGRKWDQALRGAKDIFFRDGYSGASVDDIARAAGVSKATLYTYFPEKSMMYHEVVRNELDRLAQTAPIDIDPGLSARQALPLIGRQIACWLSQPPVASLHRITLAEALRFPELVASWREMRDRLLHDPVRRHLERWSAQGELDIPDAALAAEQLIAMSATVVQDGAIFGMAARSRTTGTRAPGPDDPAIARIGDSAARLFLIAHRPRNGDCNEDCDDDCDHNGDCSPSAASA